jgi:hypothetical protein
MGGANEAEGARGGRQGRSMVEAGAGDSVRKAREWLQEKVGAKEPGARQGETRHAVEHGRGV